MKVAFRADASLDIGTGHVMRCLTLADALSQKGAEIHFICRKHTGNLVSHIESKGYFVHALEVLETPISDSSCADYNKENLLFHSHWLGSSQEEDAYDCKLILENIQPDWLIVDHYGIDKTWQVALKGIYKKLMVIDDLADRHHQCDLFLDQTYGRLAQDYQGLVPVTCQILLGSQYALLRPEFAQWREFSLKRRAQPQFKKILVTMGGVDPGNVTSRVLDALKICDLPKDMEIMVVMGVTAPHLEKLKNQAQTMPYKTQVKSSVENMAEIMANADLAIGAAGATTWERCCLGLPSILMVLAGNQKEIANLISEAGAAIKLELNELNDLCDCLYKSLNNLEKISLNSASITDGRGVNRIVENML